MARAKKIDTWLGGGQDACQVAINSSFIHVWIDPVSSRKTQTNTTNNQIIKS